jgi:hypothetical protein
MIDRRFPPPWSGAALVIPAGGKAGTVATGLWRMDKIELYKGFEIRAFEREQGRWRAEIRKADGSPLKTLVADSGHRMSITTSADTLTAEATIDEVKKAIDAGGMS